MYPYIPPSSNVGYSTYKPKRHSRTPSATAIPTEQSVGSAADSNDPSFPSQNPPNGSSSSSHSNGFNGSGLAFGSPSSSRGVTTPPTIGQPSAFFTSETPSPPPSTRATSPLADVPLPTIPSSASTSPTPSNGVIRSGKLPLVDPDPDSAASSSSRSPRPPSVSSTSVVSVTDGGTIKKNGKARSDLQSPDGSQYGSPSTSARSRSLLKPPASTTSRFRHVAPRGSLANSSPLRPNAATRTLSIGSNSSSQSGSVFSQNPAATRAFGRPSTVGSSRPQSSLSYAPSPNSHASLSGSVSAIISPLPSPAISTPSKDITFPQIAKLPVHSTPTSSNSVSTLSSSAMTIVPSPLLSQSVTPASPPLTPGDSTSNGSYQIRRQSGIGRPSTASTAVSSGAATPARAAASVGPSDFVQMQSSLAPYRPGFQPKGVYAVRTAEFTTLRSKTVDERKPEEKRLLRRLEKLVELHFPPAEKLSRPESKRASSSFVDFAAELKGKGAAEIFKGVVESSAARTERTTREAEQRITKWQDDKEVNACPICTQTFHPLTNRKHHCRLCGRVVCSLPPKLPLRPTKCSFLIKADRHTGRIEEVPDVIAYGVARRDSTQSATKEKDGQSPGVRVCRGCHDVVMRQQFALEAAYIPHFARLHRGLLRLEQQIEEALPNFRQLILGASSGDSPPDRDTMSVRKEILEMFGEYDLIAKRIRSLPAAQGSSQERVQQAMVKRASLFLQQHMLPLKRLAAVVPNPKAASQTSSTLSDQTGPLTPNGPGRHHDAVRVMDIDAELARSLQPLLEQEALLESYVEEAMQTRKFEDAQTLKYNLDEIRNEIRRIAQDGRLVS